VKELSKSKYNLELYFSKVDNETENNIKKILNNNKIVIERKCI